MELVTLQTDVRRLHLPYLTLRDGDDKMVEPGGYITWYRHSKRNY